VSERASFPLRRLAAQSLRGSASGADWRCAHVVHPLAGQGVNLGLLDAAGTCAAAARCPSRAGGSWCTAGAAAVRAWRKSEVAFMSSAIDAFDRSSRMGSVPFRGSRNTGWGGSIAVRSSSGSSSVARLGRRGRTAADGAKSGARRSSALAGLAMGRGGSARVECSAVCLAWRAADALSEY